MNTLLQPNIPRATSTVELPMVPIDYSTSNKVKVETFDE